MKNKYPTYFYNKIVNVFQTKYVNGESRGIGDYLRGCMSLIQLCEKNRKQCAFYINTPLNTFLKNHQEENIINQISNSIHIFEHHNWNYKSRNPLNITEYRDYNNYNMNFVNFCDTQKSHNNTIYIMNTGFPIRPINNNDRNIMKRFLEPKNELIDEINKILNEVGENSNTYEIIHIRTGDNYLVNKNNIEDNVLKYTNETIKKHIFSDKKYILLSDNEQLNKYLLEQNPFLKSINTVKHHSLHTNDTNLLKDLLIDFFIMSKSNRITSFSSYPHGSSFSKWCAEIYNIPYQCNRLFYDTNYSVDKLIYPMKYVLTDPCSEKPKPKFIPSPNQKIIQSQPVKNQPVKIQLVKSQPLKNQPVKNQLVKTQQPVNNQQIKKIEPNTLAPNRNLTNTELVQYINKYEDLKKAFGMNLRKAQDHWLNHGLKEGRTIN